MPTAETIDDFLAGVRDDQRAALQRLREAIRAAVPDAAEAIGYGVPAFKLDGRPLVSFGATKNHCAFYVQSPDVIKAYADELGGHRLSKGTIQFQPDAPIASDLVTRIVHARVAEVRSR